jgi:hypothetical protein
MIIEQEFSKFIKERYLQKDDLFIPKVCVVKQGGKPPRYSINEVYEEFLKQESKKPKQ